MRWLLLSIALTGIVASGRVAGAGMPAPLPTGWTADSTPSWTTRTTSVSTARRWQAISFFLVLLAVSGVATKFLWNGLACEIPQLPRLSTGSAYRVVILGGLAFVIVLAMISGARELMTPGAWRKQGWTYQLATAGPAPNGEQDSRTSRRFAIENLRTAAWLYAGDHRGDLPNVQSLGADADWPGLPGVRFVVAPGLRTDEGGGLYAYEPDLVDGPRFALLTSGLVVEMAVSELEAATKRNKGFEPASREGGDHE